MTEILDGLFLGNREDASDLAKLQTHGITHVVNCALELPNYFTDRFGYLALGLNDPDPGYGQCLEDSCRFIHTVRTAGGRVLVHCFAAVSRSPAIVLAYLCSLGQDMEQAARRLSQVVWTSPDFSFLRQLADHLGEESDEERIERIAILLLGRDPDERPR